MSDPVEVERLRRQHDERVGFNGGVYCGDGCGDWPCTVRRLADDLARLHALFAAGPDTICRTTWRDEPAFLGMTLRVECVEVPMSDLRDAFGDG